MKKYIFLFVILALSINLQATQIGTKQIKDSAITTAKIADEAVNDTKLESTLKATIDGKLDAADSAEWDAAYTKRVDTWTAPLDWTSNTASISNVNNTDTDGYLTWEQFAVVDLVTDKVNTDSTTWDAAATKVNADSAVWADKYTKTETDNLLDDKLDSADSVVISDIAYDDTTWDSNLDGASKNAIRDKINTMETASANITLEYKLYRIALGEAYTGYIDCQLVISDRSDYDTPIVDIDTATSQTSWLAYCAASDSNEAWLADGMPATDVRSIIYTNASLTRGTIYYYRWRTYKHGDIGTATDYKSGMLCL